MKVFIDTSVFIALFIKSESKHSLIKDHFMYLKKNWAQFFTSDYVLDELYTRLVYDCHASQVKKIINQLDKVFINQEVQLLKVDQQVFDQSLELLKKYCQQKISFTDCTSYCFINQEQIDKLFTLDKHFYFLGIEVCPQT